uniref:Methyltransferase-like protein 6 n=2 Tax=Anthurium amnicola TaxID=1678845 RepID=A0A1D1Y5A5_9ARAE
MEALPSLSKAALPRRRARDTDAVAVSKGRGKGETARAAPNLRSLRWSPMAAPGEEGKKIQIYASTTSGRPVTPYWREKYERDARKYWDIFYKRHRDKFFKDRHYLDKEWGSYFNAQGGQKLVVLEVGCGAGNTIFPLTSTYPDVFVHACDFSPRAVDLVKANKDFRDDRVNAFICDLTVDDLREKILPSSVDIVTMVFMLSAVAPEKMPLVVQNIGRILKPNGHVLLRDYAIGDLAQERLTCKEQQISENFYVRGDGTRAFYFSNDFLTSLFTNNGFHTVEIGVYKKQMENRSLELVMNRRWVQAVFMLACNEVPRPVDNHYLNQEKNRDLIDNENHDKEYTDDGLDFSNTITDMFDISPSLDEVIDIKLRDLSLTIKGLAKEYQHTCRATGLMLWESARFMCKVLAENPSIVAGKRVLELGCGSAGVCSMVAVQFAELVVATDGDIEALDHLKENVSSNLPQSLIEKIIIKKLVWGNKEDLNVIQDLKNDGGCGFDIIIGTDVTYNSEAVSQLFQTARALISDKGDRGVEPALILCHVQRQVSEDYIIATACQCGFRLVDRLVNGTHSGSGIIMSWFSSSFGHEDMFLNSALNIMYFQV